MAIQDSGRSRSSAANLSEIPENLHHLKLGELKALCQRLGVMEQVTAIGRLNVKAPYIEVLEAVRQPRAAIDRNAPAGEAAATDTDCAVPDTTEAIAPLAAIDPQPDSLDDPLREHRKLLNELSPQSREIVSQVLLDFYVPQEIA